MNNWDKSASNAFGLSVKTVHSSAQRFHIPRVRITEVEDFFAGRKSPMAKDWRTNDSAFILNLVPHFAPFFPKKDWLGWIALTWFTPDLFLWFYDATTTPATHITPPITEQMEKLAQVMTGVSWREAYFLLAAVISSPVSAGHFLDLDDVAPYVEVIRELGWAAFESKLPLMGEGFSAEEIRGFIIHNVDVELARSTIGVF